jgi:hypothetical protein
MDDSKAENNKAIVLEAFDTLFNKTDYTAAEGKSVAGVRIIKF